jgi:hypothetical protein
MINIELNQTPIDNIGGAPSDEIKQLAKAFWGIEKPPFILKNSERKPIKNPPFSLIRLHDIPYLFIKITFFQLPGVNPMMKGNYVEWLNQSYDQSVDFFLKDDGRTIKNSDGSFIFNTNSTDATIYGIENSFVPDGLDLKAIIFADDKKQTPQIYFYWDRFEKATNKNRIKTIFSSLLNKLIISPINFILKQIGIGGGNIPPIDPGVDPGPGGTAGVKVPMG